MINGQAMIPMVMGANGQLIPIATSISSWFNALILFIYLIHKKYFFFNKSLIFAIFKILISSLITSFLFYQLIQYSGHLLDYESEYKLLTILLLVTVTFIIYILISILTKAFKISDIKLKY